MIWFVNHVSIFCIICLSIMICNIIFSRFPNPKKQDKKENTKFKSFLLNFILPITISIISTFLIDKMKTIPYIQNILPSSQLETEVASLFLRADEAMENYAFEEAKNAYEDILKIDPKNVMAYIDLAKLYERQMKMNHSDIEYYNFALANYHYALEIEPNNPTALFYRAKLYENNFEDEKAKLDYDRLIKLYPNNGKYYFNRANLIAHSDILSAIDDLSKAISLLPNESEYYRRRGALYDWNKQYEKAILDYKTAIKLNPLDHLSYESLTELYINTGDYQQAINVISSGIDHIERYSNPRENDYSLYNLYTKRADIYALSKSAKAISDYDAAINLEPEYLSSYIGKAEFYYSMGDFSNALDIYKEIIYLNSKIDLYRLSSDDTIANAYEGIGDIHKYFLFSDFTANEYYEKSITFYTNKLKDFKVPIYYISLAKLYEKLGGEENLLLAEKTFRESIAYFEDYLSYQCYAWFLNRHESYFSAIEQIDKALELDLTNDYSLYSKAVFLCNINENNEALSYLTNAIKENPFDPLYYEKRAELYKKEGKISLSDKDISEALILHNKMAISDD